MALRAGCGRFGNLVRQMADHYPRRCEVSMHKIGIVFAVAAVLLVGATAQEQRRQASPEGTAATQVNNGWIEIIYGRPILRGRTNIFGSGADYGRRLNDGGPVWRAGANL